MYKLHTGGLKKKSFHRSWLTPYNHSLLQSHPSSPAGLNGLWWWLGDRSPRVDADGANPQRLLHHVLIVCYKLINAAQCDSLVSPPDGSAAPPPHFHSTFRQIPQVNLFTWINSGKLDQELLCFLVSQHNTQQLHHQLFLSNSWGFN